MNNLQGCIAVVAGASRGAGRGIALALGEAGAKVYVTGRSRRGGFRTEGRRETIDDTVDEIRRREGVAVPVSCDYTDASSVDALRRKLRADEGKLHILVNAVWGGNEGYRGARWIDGTGWGGGFWKQSMRRWDQMFTAGVRAYLLASMVLGELLLVSERGLIVNISDGIGGEYHGNIFWDLSHQTINRMACDMAQDLRGTRVACVVVTPGFMRTERVVEQSGGKIDFSHTESPEYVGRVIRALYVDRNLYGKSGKEFTAAQLAREYNVHDVDGRQPDFWQELEKVKP